jgi:N-acetyl-alpha-D-muramate 1-phosphate uridylyltransferase
MIDSVELLPAVILAGGLATRLRPLTSRIPKALVEIGGRPFLWHQLQLLKRSGIRHVVLLVGYLGEAIQERFGEGDEFGMRIEYSFDGPELLGTAGAIRNALHLLPEHFFVLYGDSYLPCDYRAVENAFRQSGLPALMTVYRNENLYDSSNVEYDGSRILRYDKKARTPKMHHIDYGLGVFDRDVFTSLAGDKYDLAALYQDLERAGNLAAFEVHDRFYEIGSPQGLQETKQFLSRRAVFLDRDGVLNEAIVEGGRPLAPLDPADFRIMAGVAQALTRLKQRGFLLLVVTNQPDVSRGNQTRTAAAEMERRLRAELPVDDVFTCFHDDADACECRKPRPGLIVRAAEQYGIDLSRSYITGDRWRDVDAGANAGCKTIWIDRGYREQGPSSTPDARVDSLTEAVDWILHDALESL